MKLTGVRPYPMQTLITNAVIATLETQPNVVVGDASYGIIDRGFLAIENGQIAALGPMDELPACQENIKGAEMVDAGGRLLTPACDWFDCCCSE